jgi:hypothetical protein
MTDSNGHRELLSGLSTPVPPASLRVKTLMAARRAADLETPVPAWRVLAAFFTARPAWSAALVVLVLAHLAMSLLPETGSGPRIVSPRDAEVAAQPDLLLLPRIDRLLGDAMSLESGETAGNGGRT